MVLVSGPTGVGKTTTSYAGLDTLDDRQHNIMTVEDPIEAVGQMQVSAMTNLTLAHDLRAILRQDPDGIMVDSRTERLLKSRLQAR